MTKLNININGLRPISQYNGVTSIPNLLTLNAILHVTEHGCKWRGVPERFGNWHTVYVRMNRWAKNGIPDRVFTRYEKLDVIYLGIILFALICDALRWHEQALDSSLRCAHSGL